jgi:hypothetical protein
VDLGQLPLRLEARLFGFERIGLEVDHAGIAMGAWNPTLG